MPHLDIRENYLELSDGNDMDSVNMRLSIIRSDLSLLADRLSDVTDDIEAIYNGVPIAKKEDGDADADNAEGGLGGPALCSEAWVQ